MTNEKASEILFMQWQDFLEHNIDYAGISDAYKKAFEALKLIPDNATNGDIIKVLFPNYRTDEMSHSVWVGYDDMSFRRDWWNAPYKRGDNE